MLICSSKCVVDGMIGKTFFNLKFFVFTDDLELNILIEKNTLFAIHSILLFNFL